MTTVPALKAAVRRFAALTSLIAPLAGALALTAESAVAAPRASNGPVVRIAGGAVRGAEVSGVSQFLGLPYAAAPVGHLRWRPPRPAPTWTGVRDATHFAASCPQLPSPFAPPAPFSEDCLYLNVYTPTLHRDANRPVLVWIHGGGFTQDGARNYDGSRLAANGTVAVTINYRLGALGFLAHPALASRRDGSAGNYGLMDQIAALRWVRQNIAALGGNPNNVTIAGQSAGGVSVLALLVSAHARGLFQRAIVQSGAFALTQEPLANAEAAGREFATAAGCPDQTAACLRKLPVEVMLKKFPGAAIPGVIDGRILTKSIGTALAAGRFAHVPILNGNNQSEEFIFVLGLHVTVSGGSFVPIPDLPVTEDNYQRNIAAVLGVSADRAAAIARLYPAGAYPLPAVGLSTLVSDANFACPALQVDRWTSAQVPTFAYEFDDSNAPERFAPLPPAATHSSEIQYIFDQPNAPYPGILTPGQESLAVSMRAAWASFAAEGNPTTPALAWPAFNSDSPVMSLVPPKPRVWTGFSETHHCSFWAAGSS